MPDAFLAQSALAELGALIGIPELRFDGVGCCQLAFDGGWLVTLINAPAARRLFLSCPLAGAHVPLSPAALHAMLRANFMGAGSGGGQLGLAPDGRPALQFQMGYGELSGAALLSRIDILLERAGLWADRIQRGEGGADRGPVQGSIPAGGERPPGWLLDRV